MVPSYSATLCFFWPSTGLAQSLVPLERPTKFATPIGALSGNRVQVSLPAVVLMTAVGFAATAAAPGFAAVGFLAGAAGAAGDACDQQHRESRHIAAGKIRTLRMDDSSK